MEHELHLIQPGGSLDGAKNYRHVSYSKYGTTLMKDNSKILSVRSFFSMGHGFSINYGKDVVEWLSSQKHLRILRLDRRYFEKLPMSLSKHLRYLDVSGSRIKRLPESTSSLHKLQTLNLRFCENLEQLPKGMKEMKSLVYLDISCCYSLKGMPPGMGQLKGMRKLSNFIVGKELDGSGIRELKELNGLEGELSISGLGNVKSVADFKSDNLMKKKMLTSLELIAAPMCGENKRLWKFFCLCIDVETLSVLRPHQNLRKLFIKGYGSPELPDWMMDLHVHLPNLVEIKLQKFSQCQQLLIPLGRLDSLKVLWIFNFPELITLSDDGLRHLTALQELVLYRCPKMTSLPESIQHLTTLVRLVIGNCPDLGRRCEKDKGQDWPKIAHIPSIEINGKQIQGNEEESRSINFLIQNMINN